MTGARWLSRTARRRTRAAVAASAAVLLLGGCDPCTGVVGCTVSPMVAASGRVIDFVSGRGVAGVRVNFVPVDSSIGVADAMTATTDADGLYRVAGSTRHSSGAVTAAVRLTPPDPSDVPFSVGEVTLPIEQQRGAGSVLPTWFTHPYLYALASIRMAATGAAVAGATVTFAQTGGAPLVGGGFTATTDAGGQFLVQAPGRGADSAVGTFTFSGGGLSRTYVVTNGYVTPLLTDVLPPQTTVFYQLGASLAGSIRLLNAIGNAVQGATVSFQRTGGITLLADVVNGLTPTNVNGDVDLPLRPSLDVPGTVTGDLTIQLPNGSTQVIRGVTYATRDVADVRRLGTYTITTF